jgi:CxC1 like cysteine cluster associated with KDZ transposases
MRVVESCQCRPTALQMVEQGYFPCAPLRPSLTVSIELLELVATASLHMAPNVAGWASTLESFLRVRGYEFSSKVC